jgi:uncharacterized protein YjbJ (UPF0337 family)
MSSPIARKGEDEMNQDQLKGKLDQLKGDLKRRWGRLTDDDIMESQGNMQKLMGRIRERSGDQEEEIKKWFKAQGLD